MGGVRRCLIWPSNSCSHPLLLYERGTKVKDMSTPVRSDIFPPDAAAQGQCERSWLEMTPWIMQSEWNFAILRQRSTTFEVRRVCHVSGVFKNGQARGCCGGKPADAEKVCRSDDNQTKRIEIYKGY